MNNLWEQATLIYNLPLTIGLIILCIYWVVSSIGIFDFDTDVEVELDLDADADVHVSGGVFSSIMNFVNAADVPIMLVLTVLNASMWAISISMNEQWNPNGSLLLASGFFILNFIISVLITKLVTMPIAPLFNSIKKDVESAEPLVGQVGVVKSRIIDHNYGQVRVKRDKNAPALLNCKLSETDAPLVRGDEVIVVKYDKTDRKFTVRSLSVQHEKLTATQSLSSQQQTQSTQQQIVE